MAILSPLSYAAESGAAFLQVSPSPRAYALGRSYGITALGAESIGANPANLGLMPRRFEVFSSYARLLDGTRYEHVAMAFDPFQEGVIDGFGLSVTRLQTSGLQEADSAGSLTGRSFGSGDMALAMAGSLRLSSRLRVGAAAKALQSEIAGYRSNTALAGDAGMTYTFSAGAQPISVAASLTNFGQGMRFNQDADPLPTTASLGVAAPLGSAMGVVEVNHLVPDKKTQAGVGMEYRLGPVSFRAGYLIVDQAGDLARSGQKGGPVMGGLSGGLGMRLGAARFDYALSQQASDYGTTQRVSLSLSWGKRAPRGRVGREWGNDPSEWFIRTQESD